MRNDSPTAGESLRRWGPACAVLFIALLFTGVLYLQLTRHVRSREQNRFEEAVRAVFRSAELHLDYHIEVLKGVRSLFFANDRLNREDWKKYFKAYKLAESHPGIIAVGYVLRVPGAELRNHEASVRRRDLPRYNVFPVGNRPEYFPLIYLEDVATGDPGPVGKDIFAEAERRRAMERARDTGEPSSTGKIQLDLTHPPGTPVPPTVQGFIVYLPVYRGGETPPTLEARRATLQGFIFASLHPSKLWKGAASLGSQPIVDLEIFDGNAAAQDRMLYDDDGIFQDEVQATHSKSISDSRLGQDWTFRFHAVPAFAADSRRHLPVLALWAGIAASVLLFGIAWTQAKGRIASEQFASDVRRSEETLRQTNARLQSKIAETERAQSALLQSQVRLNLLNGVLACMASGSNLRDTADRVVRRIREYFPDLRAAYATLDSSGRLKVACSVEPDGWPHWAGREFDLNTVPEVLAAFRRRELLALADVQLDPRMAPLARTFAANGSRSILALPLKESNEALGLLSLSAPEARAWSEHETVTLQEIAEHLSIAFRHQEAERKRRQAESLLAGEKELLSVTLRSVAEGIITTDAGAKVLLVNRAAEDLSGWKHEEALGRPIIEVFHLVDERTREPLPNPVESVLQTGEMFGVSAEAVLLARGEEERAVAASAAPIVGAEGQVIGAVLVFQDVTDKRKLEVEMLKASRIESLGLLSGGIAHDFNNILAGILGNVSLARMFAPAEAALQRRLEQAESACLRARDLTQQLLAFAKGGNLLKRTASLGELIDEAAGLALHGSRVRLDILHAADLWPVDLDPAQIKQVIHHLVQNAAESMPDGGAVKVRTQNMSVRLQSSLPLPAGDYVKTTVEDRGMGIHPEQLAKLFEPYFGSKPPRSGLGLATAYLIAKKHGGLICAESEVGVGTRFEVYLPASTRAVENPPAPISTPAIGTGRVLVMDDDASLRELAVAALGRLGYEVDLAKDGEEAIRQYAAALAGGRPFAAVILDLTVPGGMGGKEAIKQLAGLDPKVKAIVSSGYSTDPAMASFKEFGFKGCVNKPYRLAELAKVLHQVVREDSA